MRNLVCVFSCLCLYCTCLLSQRNAPVAGDAAMLVDLLRKDYSLVDKNLYSEEFTKDRAKVIGMFRSYLQIVPDHVDKGELKNFKERLQRTERNLLYKKELREKESDTKKWTELDKAISDTTFQIEKLKSKIFVKEIELDTAELNSFGIKFESNNYIIHVIDQFKKKYNSIKDNNSDPYAKSNQNASIQKSIPFLGGDVGFEMVIDGLSKFLAKRIKEELTTYVIDEVKTWLKDPSQNDPIAELKVILPRTNTYLLNFNANQVTNFPTQIKQYIEDDFNHIFDNVGNLRNTPRLRRLMEQYPDIDFALEAIEMIPNLSKIKNPVDYFEMLENSRNLNKWKTNRLTNKQDTIKFNIANTLSLSTMLAYSFTFIENGQPRFVGTDFISTYGSEQEFYLLYVGFLRQQNVKYYKDLKFLKEPNDSIIIQNALDSIVNKHPDLINEDKIFFGKLFKDISKNAEKVLISSTEIKKLNKTGLKIGPDTLYTYINSIIDLAQEVTFGCDTLIKYLDKKLTKQTSAIEIKEKITSYFRIASQMNEIVLDFQKKRYSTGLIKTLEISNVFMARTNNWNEKTISDAVTDLNFLTITTLNNKMKAKEWKILSDFLNSNSMSFTEVQKESISILVNNLKTIMDFYDEKYNLLEKDRNDLVNLATIANTWVKTGNITEIDKTSVKGLLSEKSFREIVISTYLGYKIADEIDAVKATLKDLKIGEVNLFSGPELIKLEISLNTFTNSIFSFILDGNSSSFTTAKNDFLNSIFELSLKIPKNTSMRNYTRVTKLIHFINDMAVSKDSDEIAKAIENFALPAGSYAIKREAKCNVSLNSFPGILVAGEISWKNKIAYGSFSPSFTAPVGFSFTWSTKNKHSNGFFIPIIDIGAFTRIYLGNNNASDSLAQISTFPEFNFKSIFSPGIFYHWGLPKSPISFNFGAQYGPGLREIKENGDAVTHQSIRIGFGAVLDIPLLSLHNKPKF